MSSSFIGSKIAIITKSQCRYTGTIIGIDTQASSIILGNVQCHGTENRTGNFLNSSLIGTIVPIMQFANSDIEDLKIVGEETSQDVSTPPKPRLPSPEPLSIHDDPAIVSAVISSTSNQLTDRFQQLNVSERSTMPTQTGETKSSWSAAATAASSTANRSKFLDDFTVNNFDRSQPQQSLPPPPRSHYPQRNFPNSTHYPRRGQPNFPQRRFGNRETFHDGGNNYDDDFDFETSNQKFTKITGEEELQQQQPPPQQRFPAHLDGEYEPVYDKKKSFFDNVPLDEPAEAHGSTYNRSRNYDTFGSQRSNNRGQPFRRANPNYSRQQQGNDNYFYRQNNNNNGYHSRY